MKLRERSPLAGVGVTSPVRVWHNLSDPQLYELALRRQEASVVSSGALSAETGEHTGRAPKDKFFVLEDSSRDRIWWHGGNQSISEAGFRRLYDRSRVFVAQHELCVQDLYTCADERHRLRVRVITELAWHALFIRHLLRCPPAEDLASFEPDLTVVCLPSLRADPGRDQTRTSTFICMDMSGPMVLIGGTRYAGEIKKAVFSVLNYLLPQRGVLPMHCSANLGRDGDSALFFGLSGTGKTTLASDPSRRLIGDDEHGWSDTGVFNFEGGCYAKTIRLSEAGEPQIWAAANRFGSVLENVVFDPVTRVPDYDDGRLTENTRAAYPLEAIPGVEPSGCGPHPSQVLFLSYDSFGVLPPVARLDPEQVRFFFLAGYTSKVAGTERGLGGVEPTFSTCFAAPFLPLAPSVYADLLVDRVREHGSGVWMLNTGLVGGGAGKGERIALEPTRAIVSAVVEGRLDRVETRRQGPFGLAVPVEVPGVPAELLRIRESWDDPEGYDRQAADLKERFDKALARLDD
ncbi:MAG TPA: phosphoenolpyruvate carboxykinase (ATP) [Candidatus Dormibacteraeota bacterium]|nr:phosphoenolpyruvate carboxykinase (ATP) [Candidatus Dormibacteraeota bacterium]